MRRAWWLALALVIALPRVARADGADGSDDEPTPAFAQPAPAPIPALDADTAARLDRIEDNQRKLESAQRRNDETRKTVDAQRWLTHFIAAFVDVGAFAVGGNGAGIRSDIGHVYYPQFAGKIAGEWVFMGDPLATAINSLGEPADGSNSREDPNDTLHSGGRPSLLVNSVGLAIGKSVDHGVSISSLVEMLPRPGQDILDVEYAYVQYQPSDAHQFLLQAGKVDSVLGVEYRSQDAFRRLGVTPSLLCRYTCGRPLGVDARMIEGNLSLSAAITDGDNFQDSFEQPTSIKASSLPTASGHAQWTLREVGEGLELGVSGAYGPQDGQPSLALRQWHYGFDAKLTNLAGFDAVAEFVQGRQPGADLGDVRCGLAQCLTYKGAYGMVDRIVAPWLTPYLRVDWRDAVHTDGVEFVYESHELRATVGANFHMTSRIMGKIEYTYVRELGAVPEFPDNVLTSSLVVKTD